MTAHRRRRTLALTLGLLLAVLAAPVGNGIASAAPSRTDPNPGTHHSQDESGHRGENSHNDESEHRGESISLKVLAPTAGQVVTGPDLAVQVLARGYRLDARYAGTPTIAGVGHFHTIIDGHLIDMSPVPPSSNRDTISMVGLQPGDHVLTIVPAGNDHMEVGTAAVNIPFTYAGPYLPEPAGYTGAGMPSITLTGPADGSTVRGSSLTLTADIQNFVLCGECYGKANVAGEGHWHIFLDLPADAMTPMAIMPHMMTMASDTTQTVSLKGVTPGPHTFTAVLVGNDHMPPGMSMIMDSVTVNVRSAA